jgi:lysophospholipase L1-like esterase
LTIVNFRFAIPRLNLKDAHRMIPLRQSLIVSLATLLIGVGRCPAQTAPASAPASAPATSSGGTGLAILPSDFIAICGDSITEQKLYSVYMEDYLLMCQPQKNLRAMQFGWGGETVGGFLGRMSNVLRFPVTVATTCYGMNDGGYGPLTPDRAKAFHDGTRSIIDTFKKSGVRLIIIGSPGAVGTKNFHVFNTPPEVYNKTLAELTAIAKSIADEQHVGFVDLHSLMLDVMVKAKAKFGQDYAFAGGDGVHPSPAGHLVMAYGFLKALGCDGNIGTITVALPASGTPATAAPAAQPSAVATDGHKILSCKSESGGAVTVEIESTRYPFCLEGSVDSKDPASTAAIAQFFPFDQDLNRLMLIVKNPGAGAAGDSFKITWGALSRTYTAAELQKGINLAADFPVNPFSDSFKKVQAAIKAQQDFETPLVKQVLHDLPAYLKLLPEEKDLIEKVASGGIEKAKRLNDAAAAAVVPVKHTIRIERVAR